MFYCPEASGLWSLDIYRRSRPEICAPKGLEDSAQGFNPGNRPPRATRPEGARDHHTFDGRFALTRRYSLSPPRKNTRAAGLNVLKGQEITIRLTGAMNAFDLEPFQGSLDFGPLQVQNPEGAKARSIFQHSEFSQGTPEKSGGQVRDVRQPLKHPASMLVLHHRHRQDRLFCSSQHAAPGPPEKRH